MPVVLDRTRVAAPYPLKTRQLDRLGRNTQSGWQHTFISPRQLHDVSIKKRLRK